MGETDISAAIATVLKLRGHRVERIIPGRIQERRSGNWLHGASDGTPDRVVLTKDGRTVWLEVKRPGEKLRPSQERWHSWAIERGHSVYVVTCVDEALEAVG